MGVGVKWAQFGHPELRAGGGSTPSITLTTLVGLLGGVPKGRDSSRPSGQVLATA